MNEIKKNNHNNNRRRPYYNNRHKKSGAPARQAADTARPAKTTNQSPVNNLNERERLVERLVQKYFNLLEQHLLHRKKFHDLFFRADPNQKNKLERLFYQSVKDIRDFEAQMAPDIFELYNKKINGLKPDTIYSENHELLNVKNDAEISGIDLIDPHLLPTQKAHNYGLDKEETVGSMDDYIRYKNIQ